jgi:hypothetical protein
MSNHSVTHPYHFRLLHRFPTIDNDDGSSFFSAEANVLIYGGAKNYLGNDKRWVGNLILFPDKWSGNPCCQLWGGENHVYHHNECILGSVNSSFPEPVGLDGTREGLHCKVDFKNESNLALLGKLSDNLYWTQDGGWGYTCGNTTAENHYFTLAEMQAAGQSIGSNVQPAADITVATLEAKAKKLLGLQ